MKIKEVNKKRECFILVINLLLSVIAISFLIGLQTPNVSASVEDVFQWGGANYKYNPGSKQWLTETGKVLNKADPTLSANDLKGLELMEKRGIDPALGNTLNEGVGLPAQATLLNGPGSIHTLTKSTEFTIDGIKYSATQLVEGQNGIMQLNANGKLIQVPAEQLKGVKFSQTAAGGAKQGFLSKMFSPTGGAMGLLKAAGWAATTYMVVGLVAGWLGASDELSKALQTAAAAGVGTFYGINAIFGEGGFISSPGIAGAAPYIGIGVGIVVFLLMYKKVEYKTITFECLPWEAPIGGADCETCNDEMNKCTEYRCKSLGQACEVENKGTGNELCFWKNPKDVASPMIWPNSSELTINYRYTNTKARPPSWGTEIEKKDKQCIDAFTSITFQISTDKPSQCRIGYGRNSTYDQMEYPMGGSNLFAYSHTEIINVPSPASVKSEIANLNMTETEGIDDTTDGFKMINGGQYELYIRCKSANGYWNVDPYKISFCVDKGPDTIPPRIVETSIRNGQPVQAGIDKVPIIVYTDEPANCKWAFTDQELKDMPNAMTCVKSISQRSSNQYYACSGTLTEVKDMKNNSYYFRCEDKPWEKPENRIPMGSSYKFSLAGTKPLNIKNDSISPGNNVIVKGATTTVPVEIKLETENGYNNGEAECYYSLGDENNYIRFLNTSSYKHSQRQDLVPGTYIYYIKCIDLGGNQDSTSTKFTVFVDKQAPQITRILSGEGKLKIYTDEDATCFFSTNLATGCNYDISEESVATQMEPESSDVLNAHSGLWETGKNYYIKCKDENDAQPNPTECSAIVRPIDIADNQ